MNLYKWFLTILLLNIGNQLSACSCANPGDLSILDILSTEYIFSGVVEEAHIDTITYIQHLYEGYYDTISIVALVVNFKVLKSYKGNINKEFVKLYTSGRSSCGIQFKPNDKYNIWTSQYFMDMYRVHRCSRTSKLSDTESEQTYLLESYTKKKKRKKWSDKNGTIRCRPKLRKGLPHGKWKFYDANGCLKLKGRFEKGIKEGLWVHYTYGEDEKMKYMLYPTPPNEILSYKDRYIIAQKNCYSRKEYYHIYENGKILERRSADDVKKNEQK